MTFLECVKNGDASKATALIETVLKQKTLEYINEQKAEVSEAVYSSENLDEAKALNDAKFAAYASKHAWKATEKARSSQHPDDHFRAGKLHTAASRLHGGAKGKEHKGQAGVHYSLAARGRKHPEEVSEGNRSQFQNSGSALRKVTKGNPRIHPCPTCKEPNRLTPADVKRGYQCDNCANREEGIGF